MNAGRCGAIVGLVTAACAVLSGGSARADAGVVAVVSRATPVDARGGTAIFSSWDAGSGGYQLTVTADAATRALPVAPSPAPFDADLGPGKTAPSSRSTRAAGHPVQPSDAAAATSTCTTSHAGPSAG